MKYLVVLILLAVLISCGTSNIGFVIPQPKRINPKLHFDKDLTGTFILEDTSQILISFNETFPLKSDSSMKLLATNYLQITDNEVNNKIDGELLVLKTSLDSSDKRKLLYLHDFDSIILKHIENPVYIYSIDSVNDWYRIDFNITSNLFKISDSNVYKEFKGKYYLNRYISESEGWNCTQFECLQKEKIISINSTSRDDISIIERLTEIEKNGVNKDKSLDPSKRTFKKFLRLQGFEDKIRLVMILK